LAGFRRFWKRTYANHNHMDIQNFLSDLKISVATSSFSNVVLDGLGDILSSESLANIILILKAVGLLATLVMIYLVIFVVIKTNLISEKLLPLKLVLNRPNKTKDSSLAAEMEKIKKKIGKKDSAEDRTAVLAASQLLERGLAKVGQKSTLFRENVEGVPYWSSVNPDQIF